MQRGKLQVDNRRVLVPGCGRGYDVCTLAKLGATVTGLELYDEAVSSDKYSAGSSRAQAEALLHRWKLQLQRGLRPTWARQRAAPT